MEISRDSLRHLYVHVPFCNGKCIYCSTYSELYTHELASAFTTALGNELKMLLGSVDICSPETIYIGGGTPTILDENDCEFFIETLLTALDMSNLKEWTVEVAPGSLTPAKLKMFRQAGVNRISIGAQSFDSSILQWAGRRHNVEDIIQTVKLVRNAGIVNIGIDIISGFPGVTFQSWRYNITNALALMPCHISVYALTVEENSQLQQLYPNKKSIIDEDTDIEIIKETERQLCFAGYVRYEISNYALQGYECVHNVSYWQGEDYLGVGPGATSRSGLYRKTNKPVLKQYLQALACDKLPPADVEKLSLNADLTERFIFAFRLKNGVDISQFVDVMPHLANRWQDKLCQIEKDGLVANNGTRWFLTPQGREMADYVARELVLLSELS